MITEWINTLEAVLEGLLILLLQVMYLFVLAACAVGIVAVLCLPLIIPYCKYLDRKEAQAKQRPPGDPRLANTQAETRGFLKGLTAALVAMSVKGRAPGLSEHAPPFGQTEARAERTLERPPP
ncbi:hypothetical protein [Ectopseudomonas alcaliphila]|uniref:Uncharacterized protein n=1 Tax=Ectopseudomonas alcaliphila TaxID=101564 RepID=A0A1G7E715_9GAMM|nr:hypothetical protein [Pseudomonas alcaliphila]MDX5990728.1 hypothetical protein [Pseudomonas alcaliphila]SDE59481.1 hypothetical protein SAMN05216575_103224 [Pseudomonas alcaliphila]